MVSPKTSFTKFTEQLYEILITVNTDSYNNYKIINSVKPGGAESDISKLL